MALFADVVEIIAPAQASPGESVQVTVRIKNLYGDTISIMVGGALEYGASPWPDIYFPSQYADVNSGATADFVGWFTMPDKAVTLHGYSYWYGSDGLWYFDDEFTKVVNLVTLTPQVSQFQIADYSKV